MDTQVATDLISSLILEKATATVEGYLKDLSDFARFAKKETIEQAVVYLLSGSFEHALKIVAEYKKEMLAEKSTKEIPVKRARGLSTSTTNRRLTVLRRIAQAANRRGLISWVLDIKNAPEEAVFNPKAPPKEKLQKMLAQTAADDSPVGRRSYAIMRLFLDLGLRRGAILSCDIHHFDIRSKKLSVQLKGKPKRHSKDVPAASITALQRWLEVHPDPRRSAPLFVNFIPGRHERLSGPGIYNIVRMVSEAAGAKTHPHALRHAATTAAIENAEKLGKTLDEVRKFTDHKDFRMVLRYRDSKEKVQKEFSDSNADTYGDPLKEAVKRMAP